MSYNVSSPVADASVASKAAKDGSDFTNPSTWRANLSVFSKDEVYGLSRQIQGGLAFDGVTAGLGVKLNPNATVGTSDFTLFERFLVPHTTPSSSVGLFFSSSALTPYTSANSFDVFYTSANAILIMMFDTVAGTYIQWTSPSLLAEYGGKIVDLSVTRSGTTLTVYINGISISGTTIVVGGGTWAASVSATYMQIGRITDTYLFNSTIFECKFFNRALSASEVITLSNQGVQESDKWGSLTAKIGGTTNNGNFEAGAGTTFTSWTAGASITVAEETVDMHSGTRCPKITGGGTIGSSGNNWFCCNSNTDGPLVHGKRYRYSAWLKRVSGTDSAQLGTGYTEFAAITNAGAWLEYTGSFVANSIITTSSDVLTFGAASGSVWLIDDVTITQIGSILDADLSAGVGYQVPDRSSNEFHGDISTTGVSHVIEKYDGHHTIIKTLAHSDISSTAATTLLCTLPKNCGIIEVEFDRGTAFDSGITVDVGISGTNAKFVSAQSLAATGKVLADSLSKVSESGTGNTSVYIKKSGSTTVGSTVVRVTYRIRNK